MSQARENFFGRQRAGNAGIVASFVIAIAGVGIGAVTAYVSENGSASQAARIAAADAALREEPISDDLFRERDAIVQSVLTGSGLERLPAPTIYDPAVGKPKIIIILDDMGIDKQAFDRARALPGPVTFSFLPYARNVDRMAKQALEEGDEILLHLPMEPEGDADPGPKALRSDMSGGEFLSALDWNLSRFDGYVGVNNHMGSKLTADEAAMKTVLAKINEEGLFFIDSVTTGDTVVRKAGARVGAETFARDVFLDPEIGDRDIIRQQLHLSERIARETGYVVVICHPRKETLDVLGPWLASAPMRGFELAPASALVDISRGKKMQKIMAMAPSLRG